MIVRLKEQTKTDLRLLGFYSLLCELFVDLYPEEIATSVAYIDRQRLRGKVKEAYERLVSSPEDELSADDRRRAKKDFTRITNLVEEIEAASPEVRAELLRKHAKEKEYLVNQTLEHVHV
jgi:hypothetical protein